MKLTEQDLRRLIQEIVSADEQHAAHLADAAMVRDKIVAGLKGVAGISLVQPAQRTKTDFQIVVAGPDGNPVYGEATITLIRPDKAKERFKL